MGKPITTTKGGICFAFPNVCKTPAPPGPPIPIPYPSIGQIKDAADTSPDVSAGSKPVVTKKSTIATTTGDSAGSLGGVKATPPTSFGGKVEFTSASGTVFANGNAIVRMFDQTKQNNGNAVGIVLGGLPTVLVGD
jgi:hypothetical protein